MFSSFTFNPQSSQDLAMSSSGTYVVHVSLSEKASGSGALNRQWKPGQPVGHARISGKKSPNEGINKSKGLEMWSAHSGNRCGP